MRDIDELKKTPGLSLKRYLILFIANFIGVYLISFGLDFSITKFNEVVLFIFFISIFNAVLWPLLTKMLMPFRGVMPTVKSMMDDKTHTLKKWETDLSSQTGASQAGILHGNNENITVFRWIEKENDNQMMQCSGVTKVKILEERISDGNGLLVENGASRSNLFSGDTDNVIFTFSKITDLRKLYNGAWFSIFSNPSDFARIYHSVYMLFVIVQLTLVKQ